MRRIKEVLLWISDVIIPGIFIYAAVTKLFSPAEFQVKLLKAVYIPSPWIPFLTYLIPVTEIAAVLMCLSRVTEDAGWILLYFLLVLFTGHLLLLHVFSPSAPCSCGGLLDLLTYEQHVYLNSGMILLLVFRMRSKAL